MDETFTFKIDVDTRTREVIYAQGTTGQEIQDFLDENYGCYRVSFDDERIYCRGYLVSDIYLKEKYLSRNGW